MGANPAQTVREIEETRDRLEADIRALEQHLPRTAAWGKKALGLAVGGGVGSTAFWFLVKRARKRRKENKAREQAKAAAAVPMAAIQLLPEQWAERVSASLENGQVKTWLLVGGAVWAGLRLMEMRQLRSLNRRLMVAQAVGPLP